MLYSGRAACDFINQRDYPVWLRWMVTKLSLFVYVCFCISVRLCVCVCEGVYDSALTVWEQIKAQLERGHTWFITKVNDMAEKNCLEIQM